MNKLVLRAIDRVRVAGHQHASSLLAIEKLYAEYANAN